MAKIELMEALRQGLEHRLGRRVVIGKYKANGYTKRAGRLVLDESKGAWRYTISFEGCHPSQFGPMNVNEIKSRMAMLSDMLHSGVILKGEKNGDDTSTAPSVSTGHIDEFAGRGNIDTGPY